MFFNGAESETICHHLLQRRSQLGDRRFFFQQFCLGSNPNGIGQFRLDSLSVSAHRSTTRPFSLKEHQDETHSSGDSADA